MKNKLKEKVRKLAKELDAVILAHNYQPPEILEIADIIGDSLDLSIKAMNNKKKIVVFCGVRFMAETASILSPKKIILLPEPGASCPMVDMIEEKSLKKYLLKHGEIPIVTYVNSSANIKAMSTVCCTSANAVSIVNMINENELLMIPDKNLAKNVSYRSKKIIHSWNGYCPVHDKLTVKNVINVKKKYPNASFIVHPECKPDVVKMADEVLSTSGMIDYSCKSDKMEFIIGTEIGLLYTLRKKNPNKKFYPALESMLCYDMKKITLRKIINCLINMEEKINIPAKIREKALISLKRMIST